jgi:hypothetical protein
MHADAQHDDRAARSVVSGIDDELDVAAQVKTLGDVVNAAAIPVAG